MAMTGRGFQILKGKDDFGNLTSSAIQINLILLHFIFHQLWTEDIYGAQADAENVVIPYPQLLHCVECF